MERTLNYLFCRRGQYTSAARDGYVKLTATALGLVIGAGTFAYAINTARSSITTENALYCTTKTLAALFEIQKQIQLFNASCKTEDPGSNMSMCNRSLLPQPMNASCADASGASFVSYLPMMIVAAGVATFGLRMGSSMVTSHHQDIEQSEAWYIYRNEEQVPLLTSDADNLSDLSTDYTGKELSGEADIEISH
jgi:hypothetical protein